MCFIFMRNSPFNKKDNVLFLVFIVNYLLRIIRTSYFYSDKNKFEIKN